MSSPLPDYLAAIKPVPQESRAAWYKNVAQTYASVMLWYAFWRQMGNGGGLTGNAPGGTLATGLGTALLSLLLAGLVCHFLFYLVPGLLGMKTGMPLYVVGTSTYGAYGGLIMPGLLMGLLQFGWMGVNAYFVGELLYRCLASFAALGLPLDAGKMPPCPNATHAVLATVFAVAIAFVGLKGIQYVARVASFFPLIPIAVLLILAATTIGGLSKFKPEQLAKAPPAAADAAKEVVQDTAKPADAKTSKAADVPKPLGSGMILIALMTTVVGFFATAGAAGADLAMNSRNSRDVQLGGLTGIALATVVAGGLALVTVAGAYGAGMVPENLRGNLDPLDLMQGGILGPTASNIVLILLAISAFPGGCFSAYIAATSFKTTMPKVNPAISVGLGTLVSIVLAVMGWAGNAAAVFGVIGASFGPICGAMAADFLLSGCKWPGPRAGFNLPGWISWAVGFIVGAFDPLLNVTQWILDHLKVDGNIAKYVGSIPCPPVAAFVVGFVLYALLAKVGLESKKIDMPQAKA